MAVFLVNICKFSGCGLTYPSLGDLIQHIEETHIDYDPHIVEQQERRQPSSIPLSSALRFYSNLPSKRSPLLAKRPHSSPPTSGTELVGSTASSRANSTGSSSPSVTSEEMDEGVLFDLEDSNDSWTTQEEFSAEFIMRYGSKPDLCSVNDEKPYSCPVPGCSKRYKNVNGIKYHAKNGHKKDSKIKKMYKCHCGKSYKSSGGLRSHAMSCHPGISLTTITTASGEVLQIPTNQVTTLQPVRVSLSALMSGQLGTLPLKSLTAGGPLLATSFKDCLLKSNSSARLAEPSVRLSGSAGLLLRRTGTDELLLRRNPTASISAAAGLIGKYPASVQLGVSAATLCGGGAADRDGTATAALVAAPLTSRMVTQQCGGNPINGVGIKLAQLASLPGERSLIVQVKRPLTLSAAAMVTNASVANRPMSPGSAEFMARAPLSPLSPEDLLHDPCSPLMSSAAGSLVLA